MGPAVWDQNLSLETKVTGRTTEEDVSKTWQEGQMMTAWPVKYHGSTFSNKLSGKLIFSKFAALTNYPQLIMVSREF